MPTPSRIHMLPAPSWASGFARCAAESMAPHLWEGVAYLWAPFLGPTGSGLHDLGSGRQRGAVQSNAIWTPHGIKTGPGAMASAYVDCGIPRKLEGISGFTVLAYCKPLTGFISWLIEDSIFSNWPELVRMRLDIVDAGRLEFEVKNSAPSSNLATITTGDLLNTWAVLGGKWDGTNIYAVHDGSVGTAAPLSGTAGTGFAQAAWLGDDPASSGGRAFDGITSLLAVWKRVLSDDEIMEWSRDPFAMLRRSRATRYFVPTLPVTNPDEFTAAGSLVPYLTAGTVDEDQPDPRQSLGGHSSQHRAALHGFVAASSIAGLRIDWVSPTCGSGPATISTIDAGTIAFTPPDGQQGPPVAITNGQTKVIPGADGAKFILATRYQASDLAGVSTLKLGPTWHNVLCGSDVSEAETAAGSRRVHMILFRSRGTSSVQDIRVWTKPLGPVQVVGQHGLSSSGAGELQLPDVGDIHPETRFFLITGPDGDTSNPKEICSGYLDGDRFIIPAGGRGIYGKGPAAIVQGDLAHPYSGVRIAGETTPSGSLPSGWPVANEKTAPSGQSWRYGLTFWNGEGWSLPAGDTERLGIWIQIEVPAGGRRSAVVPVNLAWLYTVDGVQYWSEAWAYFRWAEDLSAARYLAFRSVDGSVIDYSAPILSAAALPMDVPAVDDAQNRVEVWQQNNFGLRGKLAEFTVLVAGGVESTPAPDPPSDLNVQQTDTNEIRVDAQYKAALDPNPGDQWSIAITNLTSGLGNVSSTQPVDDAVVALLSSTYTDAVNWVDGDVLKVDLKITRTSDAKDSAIVSAQVTLDNTAPAPPPASDLLVADRKEVLD